MSRLQRFCALAAASCLIGCGTKSSNPSGADVLRECRDTYAHLSSYSGVTTCTTKMIYQDAPIQLTSSATINFARPAKLRVDGTIMGGQGHFAIVTEGSGTWITDIDGISWKKTKDAETAIATMTGVSGSAATTIPAILTGSPWGDPFVLVLNSKVDSDTISGRAVWRITGSTTGSSATLWIDRDSHLLAKMVTKMDMSKLMGSLPLPRDPKNSEVQKEVGEMAKRMGGYEVTEINSDIVVNHPIPDSTFSRSWKPTH